MCVQIYTSVYVPLYRPLKQKFHKTVLMCDVQLFFVVFCWL